MSRLQTAEADVLVIGSGAAGLYAGLCAAGEKRQVAVITRSDLKTSSSAWAQGGIAAAISPDDSPDLHLKDTIEAGRGLCKTHHGTNKESENAEHPPYCIETGPFQAKSKGRNNLHR